MQESGTNVQTPDEIISIVTTWIVWFALIYWSWSNFQTSVHTYNLSYLNHEIGGENPLFDKMFAYLALLVAVATVHGYDRTDVRITSALMSPHVLQVTYRLTGNLQTYR